MRGLMRATIEGFDNNNKLLGKRKCRIKKNSRIGDFDPLSQIYEDQDILLLTGNAYPAYVVQANVKLFEKGRKSLPAYVVFSTDEYYIGNEHLLDEYATTLFSYKGASSVPDYLKEVVEVVTDQRKRVFNVLLPHEMTDGRDVYFTIILVERKHLPTGKLSRGDIPLLAAVGKVKSSMMLPYYLWSDSLIESWKNG
jgi:hypothetical protein